LSFYRVRAAKGRCGGGTYFSFRGSRLRRNRSSFKSTHFDFGNDEGFIKRLSSHESCSAFDDLRISPVSLSYVLDAILAIATSKHDGVFHLSGADEMTYADFARRLATCTGASQDLVRPLSSMDSEVKIFSGQSILLWNEANPPAVGN